MFWKDTSFSRALTLVGLVLSGTLLGFYWQRMADSGYQHMSRILLTCTLSIGSYLVAFFAVELFAIRRRVLRWVIPAVTGSVLSAFNTKVVKFLIVNMQDEYATPFLQLLDIVVFGFLACAVFFTTMSLLIVASIQLLGRPLQRRFSLDL